MTGPALPVELQPWEAALGVLDIDLATGLGPVVRTLDALLGARVHTPTSDGERDGWSGVSRRGDPDRLLVSEWLLADVFPDEFLRRAVSGELLHLAPAFHDDTPRGRVACVVDVGPDQLGAGRIVQLAALVVLVRYALAQGTTLRLGLAAGDTVRWSDGPFETAARAWLRARSVLPPHPDVVRQALDDVGEDATGRPDQVWLLCGPELAAHLRGRPRTVVSAPGDWDEDGLRTVRVRMENRAVTVTLPPARVTVRALRGTGLTASTAAPAAGPTAGGPSAGALRWPTFAGPANRFVGRAPDPRVLVTHHVGAGADAPLKRHGFTAPVLAAGFAGKRLVALLDRGDALEVQVVGRPLGGLHGESWSFPDLVPADLDHPPELLAVVDRTLLWRHAGGWWRIGPAGVARADGVLAVGWSGDGTSPRVVRRDPWPSDLPVDARDAAAVLAGPRRSTAWTTDGRVWTLHTHTTATVVLDEGEHPLGIATVSGDVGLVTVSASGRMVRWRGDRATRTFTRLSGAGVATGRSLHPTRPWLLVARQQGVYVVDLEADAVVTRVVDR